MYTTYIMKRTQIYLEDDQDEVLESRAGALGRTKSDLIREAIDSYLGLGEGEAGRLEAFREALAEAAGSAAHLPPGSEYVEEIRRADAERQDELDRKRDG